jgi:hypothetical protein
VVLKYNWKSLITGSIIKPYHCKQSLQKHYSTSLGKTTRGGMKIMYIITKEIGNQKSNTRGEAWTTFENDTHASIASYSYC